MWCVGLSENAETVKRELQYNQKKTVKEVMKHLFLVPFMLLIFTNVKGKSPQDSIQQSTKYKTLYRYTYGLQRHKQIVDDCRKELSEIYGYTDKVVAGCLVTSWQVMRWDRHNKRVSKKMERRFGKDWKEKYNSDLKKCQADHAG